MRVSQGGISFHAIDYFYLRLRIYDKDGEYPGAWRVRRCVCHQTSAQRAAKCHGKSNRTSHWQDSTRWHERGGVELHRKGRLQAVQDRMTTVRMNDQSASRSSCRTIITKSPACEVGRDAVTSLGVIKEAVRKADGKIHGNSTDTETDPETRPVKIQIIPLGRALRITWVILSTNYWNPRASRDIECLLDFILWQGRFLLHTVQFHQISLIMHRVKAKAE